MIIPIPPIPFVTIDAENIDDAVRYLILLAINDHSSLMFSSEMYSRIHRQGVTSEMIDSIQEIYSEMWKMEHQQIEHVVNFDLDVDDIHDADVIDFEAAKQRLMGRR